MLELIYVPKFDLDFTLNLNPSRLAFSMGGKDN